MCDLGLINYKITAVNRGIMTTNLNVVEQTVLKFCCLIYFKGNYVADVGGNYPKGFQLSRKVLAL